MNRRSFIANTTKSITYSLFLSQLYKLKFGDGVNIHPGKGFRMESLRGGVGFFTERGGTIGWMASQDGIVIVDTQFPEQAQHLVDEIQKMNLGNIDLLINTHHHGDHTAGNTVFSELTDTILAHENSKKNQKNSATKRGTENQQVYPNKLFKSKTTEVIGDEKVTLHYFGAAHTDGDAIIHFENANVVHMGDLVFNRRFPYIDKSAGANINNWIKVLDRSTNTFDDDTQFIWGHSDNGHDVIGRKEDINAFKNYLEKLLEFGQICIRDGKTLEEVKTSVLSIPGAPEWKGKGIERSLKAVFSELSE